MAWIAPSPASVTRVRRPVGDHRVVHDHGGDRDVRRLLTAAALVTAFLAVEVVVAVLASSLALLADAGHMLTDVLALLFAAGAARLAQRPATDRWTYGLGRVEVLSAAVNGVTLLVVAAVILVESVRRLVNPPDVVGAAVAVTALAGLVVNLLATGILFRADRRSLNVAGAFAHILTDAYAFAATLAAGLVVMATGFSRADPIASLLVVALMLRSSWSLLRRSGAVLLERAPDAVDLAELRGHLVESTHVLDVHDLHAWTVGSGLPAVSVHVVVADECFRNGDAPRLLDELQQCLVGHFDVEHSTFQLEAAGHAEHEPGTH
jgi:cobalt-zinc-cadmium efflux system protein